MKPPIKVEVRKDNHHNVVMIVSGADGYEHEVTRIQAVCSISAFEAFHEIAPALEVAMNRMLAAHGIVEVPSSAPDPARAQALAAATLQLRADIQALRAEKEAFDLREQLAVEKLALEEEVAEMREHDAWLDEPDAEAAPTQAPPPLAPEPEEVADAGTPEKVVDTE